MPFPELAQTLRSRSRQVSEAWHARFLEAYPQAERMLPPGERMPEILLRAAAAVLERSPGELRDNLRALALDLRRTGFPAEEYPATVQLLIDAFGSATEHDADLSDLSDLSSLAEAAEIMREAASLADHAGVPAATAARVTSVEDRGGVQVVRVEAGTPVIYSPGQVLPVMSSARPGEWTGLIPAIPSNPLGQLEFHIPGDLAVTPGEWLTLGAPRGGLRDVVATQLLVIAAEGGFAAAKALVFHYLDEPEPPAVHLVVGAGDDEGLYDTVALDALAATQGWLDVTWIVESRVGAPLEQVVAGAGMWWQREVIVCADAERASSLASSLEMAGARDVQVIAHDAAPEWF